MTTKPRCKPILFTDAMRCEICTPDSYWLDTMILNISLADAVDHCWENKTRPTLKQVVLDLVNEAYNRGREESADQIRNGIKSLIRAR